jgi:hypothetical protein
VLESDEPDEVVVAAEQVVPKEQKPLRGRRKGKGTQQAKRTPKAAEVDPDTVTGLTFVADTLSPSGGEVYTQEELLAIKKGDQADL